MKERGKKRKERGISRHGPKRQMCIEKRAMNSLPASHASCAVRIVGVLDFWDGEKEGVRVT